jgi:hypothetical protein
VNLLVFKTSARSVIIRALVAVATLGLGLLSVAPSSATAIAISVTPSATTSAIKVGETATISLTVSGVIAAANDSITVNAAQTAGSSGTINFLGTTDSTTANVKGSGYQSSITIDREETGGTRAVVNLNFINPTTKGEYKVLVYTTANNRSVQITPFTWTITVTADSTSNDANASTRLVSGLWTALTDPAVDATVSAAKSAGISVPSATIKVLQKNATSSANEGLVVTLAGPGYLATDTTDTSTVASPVRILSVSAPGPATAQYIKVLADGTAEIGRAHV